MKQKLIAYVLILIFISTSMVAISQYGWDEEERKRCSESGSCTYDCWYRTSDGTWYSIPKAGLYVDCPRCETKSDCQPQACYPVGGC